MKNTTLGIISGLSAAAIWGAMYVVSKAVMAVIPPFSLLTSRLILGIATLFIIAFLQKKLTILKMVIDLHFQMFES